MIKNLKTEKEKFEIAITGGVFKAREFILPYFKGRVKEVAPKTKFIEPRFEPAIGAIFLGLREIGVEIDDKILKRVNDSSARLGEIKGSARND